MEEELRYSRYGGDSNFDIIPPKDFKGFNDLRKQGILIDVNLNVNGKILPVHKVVLSAYSIYFRTLFTIGMIESKQSEIKIEESNPKLFEQVIDYFYGEIDIKINTWETLMDFIEILRYYGIETLDFRFNIGTLIVPRGRAKDFIEIIKYFKFYLRDYEYEKIAKSLVSADDILELTDEEIKNLINNYLTLDLDFRDKIIQELRDKGRNLNFEYIDKNRQLGLLTDIKPDGTVTMEITKVTRNLNGYATEYTLKDKFDNKHKAHAFDPNSKQIILENQLAYRDIISFKFYLYNPLPGATDNIILFYDYKVIYKPPNKYLENLYL